MLFKNKFLNFQYIWYAHYTEVYKMVQGGKHSTQKGFKNIIKETKTWNEQIISSRITGQDKNKRNRSLNV